MVLVLLDSEFKHDLKLISAVKTFFSILGFPYKLQYFIGDVFDKEFPLVVYHGRKNNIIKKIKKTRVLLIPVKPFYDFPEKALIRKLGNEVYELNFDIFSLTTDLLIKNKFDLVRGFFSKPKKTEHQFKNFFLMEAIKKISDYIIDSYSSRNCPLIRKCYWPEGKNFAGCLTHDVDVPFKYNLMGVLIELKKSFLMLARFRISEFIKINLYILNYLLSKKDPYLQFDKIMTIEKKFNYKSTFYFFSKRQHKLDPDYEVSKLDDIIQKLIKNNFEIGLHGSYTSFKNIEKLISEKKILENLIHKKLAGIRQHFLNFEYPKTWIAQNKAGFIYDSTFGYKDNIGSVNGLFFPFYVYVENRISNLIEIPLIVMDGAFFSVKKINCWTTFKKFLDKIIACDGLISLNWHQRVFFDKDFRGWGNLYFDILNYLKAKDAYVSSAEDIAKWFKKRSSIDFLNFDLKKKYARYVLLSKENIKEMCFYLFNNKSAGVMLNTKLNYEVFKKNGKIIIKFKDIKKNKKYMVDIR